MHFPNLPILNQLPDIALTGKLSDKTIEQENALVDDICGRNVLVTGGTSGIGAAIAIAFAKRGANIHVAGRNKDAANEVLSKAKAGSRYASAPDSTQVFEFHSFDASSTNDCKRFANEMLSVFAVGLDWLVMTQGGVANGERKETKEGHEWYLAIHDISRYIVAATLLPALKKAKSGRGVVLDVLSAGVWNKFDENNLQLWGKNVDFFHMSSRDGPIHEIMTLEFNERCPSVIYNHLYPGPTKTKMNDTGGSSFIIKAGFAVATQAIGQTAEHYAEAAYHTGTRWEPKRNPNEPGRTWGTSGEPVEIREYPRQPEVRDKIWKFLESETGIIVPANS